MAQAPLGQMIIELGLDSSDFGKGLQSSKREVKYWASDMKASMRAADLAGNQIGKFEAKHQGLTKVIGAQRKTVDQLKQSYDNSFVDGKPTAQTEKLAAQLRNAESQLISYNKQLAVNAGDMAKWKVENEGITGGLNKLGGVLEKRGKQMADFGDKMTTRVTLPIVAGVGLAVKAAMDWESAFAGVRKTNDEVVDSNGNVVYSYADLEDGLRGLAKELPATHREIAEVGQAAGQLGIETEKVTSFTKTMIDLGESTNLSAEQAATSLARLANITNMSQDDFDRLGSSIVKVGNNFATTESEITELAMRLAGAGSQIGMSEADIVGLAGALSSVGVEAQAGGTALSKTMINMKVATETGYQQMLDLEQATGMTRRELELMSANSSKDFTALAASMGKTSGELNKIIQSGNNLEDFAAVANMSAKDFKQAFEKDAVGALGAFIEGLGAAEEKGTSAIQLLDDMGISEVRLRDSLLRAGNASELFARSVEMSNDAWEENTALSTEANIRYETLESQLGMLRNEANDVAITFGGPFVGALKDGLVTARPLIERLADMAKAFSDMDPEMQQMIIKTLAITAAAGPLLSITGRVAQGIGGLTTKSVGFLGVMARKKTIKEFTAQLAMGSTDILKWSGSATAATTATGNFGGAAATAAGAKGVGAMTTQLGLLGPVGWGIVGVGGLLAVGYGAWKLWGEEAYNAGQRTKRWGTDVGEAADEALGNMKGATDSISSDYQAMRVGVNTDTDSMMESFQNLGSVVEEELSGRIEKFGHILEEYSDVLSESTKEMVTEEQKALEDSLGNITGYVERANEIRQKEQNSATDISAETAKILSDLSREVAKEYIGTLASTSEEQQSILEALTGNIDTASKDQALTWAKSLAEQRQELNIHSGEMEKEAEKLIESLELDPEGDLANSIKRDFEGINREAKAGVEAQLALIAEKYPEIAKEISFGNGQLASEMQATGAQMLEANQGIIDRGTRMVNALKEAANESIESTTWMANEARRGADQWNDLYFEAKQGDFETDLPKLVNEAAQDTQKWNNLRFQLKDANLNSNAKQIIGEAAIQNGWWDGMSWEEKQIIINDEFSETIIRSLDTSGKWNELALEEKTALMYSNTPESMTETLAYLGLWDEYETEIKRVDADNYGFMVSMMESEEKMSLWQNLNPEVKELLANNYDLLTKLFESDEAYNRFKELPDENKLILGENADLMAAILESEDYYNRWMGLPELDKKFLGDNTDLLSTVLNSESEFKRWLNIPTEEKRILGNNIDLISKIVKSEEEYNAWKKMPEFEKKLKVNNYGAVTPTQEAQGVLKDYKNFNPGSKNLPITTNAESTKSALDRARDAWSRINSGTKTFTTRYETVGQAPKGIGPYATRAMGTNFHPGGAMLVNDQKGAKFRELIQRPDGTSYIPGGRNVFLPNEPIGTKVFKASLTDKMFPGIPQYANGVGIPSDSTVIQGINRVREAATSNQSVTINNDFKGLETLLKQMLNVISRQQPKIEMFFDNYTDLDVRKVNEDLAFLTQIKEGGSLSSP